MFKSIEYCQYDLQTKSYIYKLVDTEFECEVELPWVVNSVTIVDSTAAETAAVIVGYKRRNYSHKDIVKNLFRCILFLCNKFNVSLEEELNCQNDSIDKYFKGIKFSKLYYQDLKDMWDKHKAFM